MNDPQVVSLKYRLETIGTVSFSEPPPIEAETKAFHLKLANEILAIEFKEHIGSIEAARRIVEPYLRAWEIDNSLQMNRQEIEFSYDDAVVIDRNPLPLGSTQVIYGQSIGSTLISIGDLLVSVTRPNYPAPPINFVVTPDVESLWRRYEGYVKGQEPLQSMAYFVLTWLEAIAEDRRKASELYAIDFEILKNIGELSSNTGDAATARKRSKKGQFKPLTGTQKRWLESAVKVIIRRFGEIDVADSLLKKIAMEDLPKLSQ